MWNKIRAFFETEFGEILRHCFIAICLAFLSDWIMPLGFEALFDMLIIAGFMILEMSQHDWKFSEMGSQSWLEFIIPAFFVIVVFFAT